MKDKLGCEASRIRVGPPDAIWKWDLRGGEGAFLLLVAISVGGCEEETLEQICNENPANTRCLPEDGSVPENSAGCGTDAGFCLTYYEYSENGTTTALGLSGQVAAKVAWQLIGGARADGAVVQKISKNGAGLEPLHGATCSEAVSLDDIWWEMFPVAEGEILSDPRWDNWGEPNHSATGQLLFVGEASFYTNAEMSDELADFVGQGAVGSNRHAGVLRSFDDDDGPDFWESIPKPRLQRAMKISWQDCPDAATQLICSYTQTADDCEL